MTIRICSCSFFYQLNTCSLSRKRFNSALNDDPFKWIVDSHFACSFFDLLYEYYLTRKSFKAALSLST